MSELSAAEQAFVTMARDGQAPVSSLVTAAPTTFPWVGSLPAEDVRAFVVELAKSLRTTDSANDPAATLQVIAEWRHTAEVHADPELCARLTAEVQDHGSATIPPSP